MRITIAILSLALLCGCGRKKMPTPEPSKVSEFKTSALPIPPPPADVAPVTGNVEGAKTNVESAKKDVQNVLNVARASDAPVAKQAVPPLSSADNQLASALAHLNAATSDIAVLKESIKKSEESRAQNEEILKKDIARLESACKIDNAALNKQIMARDKRISDLENESLRKARMWLLGVGLFLTFGGIAGVALFVMQGFGAGKVLGPIAGLMGAICLWLSANLDKVMWWTGFAIATSVVIGLGVAAYHLFKHDPKKGKHAKEDNAPKA